MIYIIYNTSYMPPAPYAACTALTLVKLARGSTTAVTLVKLAKGSTKLANRCLSGNYFCFPAWIFPNGITVRASAS